MKQHHGLARATGYGLRSMQIQAKLTTLAVNLKRIAKIGKVNGNKIDTFRIPHLCDGDVIRAGRLNFVRIRIKS